jgi:acetyltransferase-like isoleucine patch superfamily enzyme
MIHIIIKKIISLYCSIRNYYILKNKKVNYGENLKINGILNIFGRGKLFIGRNVTINSGLKYNSITGDNSCNINISKKGEIIIRNNVGISNCSITSWKSIIIDDDVLIGSGCIIVDTDFHTISFNQRKLCKNVKCSTVHIEKGVFIGAKSIILKGVTIGKYSVIGAGSVVTKNIPSNEIWAGNPAIFIKKVD